MVQLVVQSAALGLLAYLIGWTTQTGAPNLFKSLGDLRSAIENTGNRLKAVEDKLEELQKRMEKRR